MRLILLLLYLLVLLNASSQHADSLRRQASDARWGITASPLALVQLDFTVVSGIEYKLRPRLRLVMDAGFIFGSAYHHQQQTKAASGFLVRPGIKLFPKKGADYYVQGQVFYKQVTYWLYDWLDKNVVNGVASGRQQQEFRYRRHVVGFNTLIGIIRPLRKNGRSFFDFYLGLGIRKKFLNVVGEENSRYDIRDNRERFVSQTSLLPSLPMGVRLLFFIR